MERTPQEMAECERICRRCPRWRWTPPGCELVAPCRRRAVMGAAWRNGDCPDNKWKTKR